jgi:hypothetical protein
MVWHVGQKMRLLDESDEGDARVFTQAERTRVRAQQIRLCRMPESMRAVRAASTVARVRNRQCGGWGSGRSQTWGRAIGLT